MKKLAFLFSLAICFLATDTLGQGTSNKGTDFWVAYAGHVDALTSRLTLFISAQSTATVTINAGGTILPQITVPANQALPVTLDPNVYKNIYVGLSDGILSKSGIHLTSDVPIVVYSLISHNARSAASLIFPTKALGREYYATSYLQSASNTEIQLSEFTILGVEDNTEVQITPSQKSVNSTRQAGVPFTITLNKGDIYQYQSNTDITGSKIETTGDCKPIAVFSGSTKTQYCESGVTGSSGDNLYQQLTPYSAWGKNFVTAPFYNTVNGSTDIYRIIVGKDNANITVNGSTTSANGTSLKNPYAKGSVITFTSQSSNVISSDQPISLTQLQTTQACNPKNVGFSNGNAPYPGDPEMTVLTPIEQTLTDVTLFSAVDSKEADTQIITHYINVIMETSDIDNLKIDGQPIPASSFKAIDNRYSYLIYNATQSSATNPSHRVTSLKGFVAIAYGYGPVESYAYLGGSDLRNLNQYLEAETFSNPTVVTSGCVGVPFNFTLRLPYITQTINWDFGDGSTYTENAPAYTTDVSSGTTVYIYTLNKPGGATYTKSGNYLVRATVLNPAPTGCNAIEDVDYSFDAYDPPVASFAAAGETCAGSPLTFTDKSTDAVNTITQWAWDFGDGKTDTHQNPVHTYLTRGSYQVKLTVTSATGCSSNYFQSSVVVNDLPVAKYTYNPPDCETKDIVFTDASTSKDGSINSWTWNFGDGSAAIINTTSAPVSHNFTKYGTYTVTLAVSTDKTCTSVVYSNSVVIYPLPVVDFDLPEVCLKDPFALFTNKSTIADHSGLSYLWNFGDAINSTAANPNTSTSVSPTHKYIAFGDYSVTLTVTSVNGCTVTLSKPFTVNGSVPKPDFTVLSSQLSCSSDKTMIQDKSTVDFGQLTKIDIYWDFATASSVKETDDNPAPRAAAGRIYSHQYPVLRAPQMTRDVTIKMIAYSGSGTNLSCQNEMTQTITLKAVPLVAFTAIPPICLEKSAILLNEATETTNFIGTGTYSGNGVSPEGLFTPAIAGVGDHTLTYTFVGTNGCTDQQSQVITVYPTPSVNAGQDLYILQGGETTLNPTAKGSNLTYKWYPSAGLSKDDIATPVASPVADITYTLTVTSDQGCSATDAVFVKVLKAPEVPNTFTPNGDGINDVWNIKYLESYPGASIQIYNRYGAKVFEGIGYTKSWDGRNHGDPVPEGVYYYIIDPKNGRRKIQGTVTVLR